MIQHRMLMTGLVFTVIGQRPTHEIGSNTHEHAMIVDRVCVIGGQEQFAIAAVDSATIAVQAIQDFLTILQSAQSRPHVRGGFHAVFPPSSAFVTVVDTEELFMQLNSVFNWRDLTAAFVIVRVVITSNADTHAQIGATFKWAGCMQELS